MLDVGAPYQAPAVETSYVDMCPDVCCDSLAIMRPEQWSPVRFPEPFFSIHGVCGTVHSAAVCGSGVNSLPRSSMPTRSTLVVQQSKLALIS